MNRISKLKPTSQSHDFIERSTSHCRRNSFFNVCIILFLGYIGINSYVCHMFYENNNNYLDHTFYSVSLDNFHPWEKLFTLSKVGRTPSESRQHWCLIFICRIGPRSFDNKFKMGLYYFSPLVRKINSIYHREVVWVTTSLNI